MSTEASRHSTAPSTTISETFNRGSGDFALISSDEEIFYIPRAILQFSSKVFEAMFEAGTPSSGEADPIRMQADARHLEMILKFAHPGHINPPIPDVATLAELLRIAKQYEMESVKDQLRMWFMKARVEGGVLISSITISEPLAAFVVAISFECVDEARYALAEVIKCGLEQELGPCKKYEIPLYLMQYILNLRAGRATWLKARLRQFSKLVRDSCYTTLKDGSTSNFMKEAREDASSLLESCVVWEQQASAALDALPSFVTLKDLICDANYGAISSNLFRKSDLKVVWKMIAEFEESTKTLESAPLPELDKSLRF